MGRMSLRSGIVARAGGPERRREELGHRPVNRVSRFERRDRVRGLPQIADEDDVIVRADEDEVHNLLAEVDLEIVTEVCCQLDAIGLISEARRRQAGRSPTRFTSPQYGSWVSSFLFLHDAAAIRLISAVAPPGPYAEMRSCSTAPDERSKKERRTVGFPSGRTPQSVSGPTLPSRVTHRGPTSAGSSSDSARTASPTTGINSGGGGCGDAVGAMRDPVPHAAAPQSSAIPNVHHGRSFMPL